MPGGVLDILLEKKPKNLRIIFLTFEGFKKFLEPYFGKEDLVFEFIPKYEPKSFLKTLFRFFYSYLIFTGTTRVLATFGARADIPPAGGNRHLAPLKSFVAGTFGRFNFIKTKFVPWLFGKIFNERPYACLFEKYSPELLFATSIAFFPDAELIAEARRRGVQTVGMVPNWDHLNKYFLPLQTDWLLVQNEPMLKEAVELQAYPESKITIVGFPQFDFYARYQDFLIPKDEFFERFNIPKKSKVILFISGAAYSLDEPDILEEIASWIKARKFAMPLHLFVRPYVVLRDREREEKKYRKLMGNPLISFNWLKTEGAEQLKLYLSMLFWADVVISIFSTTAIEAAILDKPTLTIGFDGYKRRPYHQSIRRLEDMSHFKNVLGTESVRVVRNFEDLYRSLNEYLHNPARDREKRKFLVQKMCYRQDGRASERLADFIFEKVNE